jgi:hypothetical protein
VLLCSRPDVYGAWMHIGPILARPGFPRHEKAGRTVVPVTVGSVGEFGVAVVLHANLPKQSAS